MDKRPHGKTEEIYREYQQQNDQYMETFVNVLLLEG